MQPPAKRRGPKPAISDQALLDRAIEADLEASPWEGEGVPARSGLGCRVCRDIRVARKRVLRLMRLRTICSRPIAAAAVAAIPMTVRSSAHAPNLMWGTDGVRVFTVDDRRHEGLDLAPPSSIGTPSAVGCACLQAAVTASSALQPISMGLAGLYGSTARRRGIGGMALRMDHGSQYLSDHFTNQIKFWGIQPSYAFVAEPQTNGVAERFNRTLKEQMDPWSRSTATSAAACGTPSEDSSNSTMPSGSSKRTAT